MNIMKFKTTVLAGSFAAALGMGTAGAQTGPQYGAPAQQAPYGHVHHGHHHGLLSLIQGEVDAGRISQNEGALLEKKIKEWKREKRAERQARYEGEQGRSGYGPGYGQGN